MRRMTVSSRGGRSGTRFLSSARSQSSPRFGRSSVRLGRSVRRALVTAPLVLAALALYSVPAQALSQRGHEFAGSFGESGEPVNPSQPSALAVNEATGDVYVLEAESNRVVVYGPAPEHEFIEVWGYGVRNGEKKLEACTEKCEPGLAGFGKEGELDDPVAIAVDNSQGPSSGDVYVVANRTWKKAAVYKFTSKGGFVGNLVTKAEKEEELEGAIQGVAVDRSGNVWVEREDEEEEVRLEQFAGGTLGGRTTIPQEEFSLAEEGPLAEWFDFGELTSEEMAVLEAKKAENEELEISSVERPVRPGFAIDTAGDFYVTYEPFGHYIDEIEELKKEHEHPETLAQPCALHRCFTEKLTTSPTAESDTAIAKLARENTTGLGVDASSGEASNDVYVDNGSSVAVFTPSGTLIQRFGSSELEHGGGGGVAVDSATDEVLVADAVEGKTGRIESFTPEKEGAPVIEPGSPFFSHARATSAALTATIDPHGKELGELHYYFQYGTASCASSPESCTQLPPELEVGEELKEGFGEQTVSVRLTGLSPSTTYHYRVIAESSLGKTVSAEGTFATQTSAVQASMLDGRAWELVSPSNKHGASIRAIEKEGGLVQAAANGNSVVYTATGPVGENEEALLGARGPEPTEVVGQRHGTHWSAEDIATENGVPAQGLQLGGPWEYEYFSPELSTAFVNPYSAVPPSTETEKTERNIYLRQMTTCATSPSTCYLPLVNAGDDTANAPLAEAGLFFESATPDLKHVVFNSAVGLTTNAAAKGHGLYEWSKEAPASEQLQLVSVLPSEAQAPGTVSLNLGGFELGGSRTNAISENGSRIVWSDGERHLYMRELRQEGGHTVGQTLHVDEADSTAPRFGGKLFGEERPIFQGANPEGTRVFFTDAQRLTSDATGGQSSEELDLYVFEPEKPLGQQVTDLTPDLNKLEAAAVQGGVLGMEERGSYVYFVANGVLASGAEPGNCRTEEAPPGSSCNLYVVHDGASGWEQPQFIARLSNEDRPDWGGSLGDSKSYEYEMQNLSARVSPDGEYLAFMSKNSLTGYDNVDANSGQLDEEVYLYHYGAGSTGKIVCASCNPSGEPPVGVLDNPEAGEGEGLLVDRPQSWPSAISGEVDELEGIDSWLAASLPGWTGYGQVGWGAVYQSRYLSDSGRLFFNSADPLVPLAKPSREEPLDGKASEVGLENVYEYEPRGQGSCTTENTTGGCVELISSGESEHESAFLDASKNGNDVFFLTSAKLSPADPDTTYDIYDARVCTGSGPEACPTPPPESSPECTGEDQHNCRPGSTPPPTFAEAASSTSSGSGNIAAKAGTLNAKTEQKPAVTPKPKAPTRAQLLAKALKTCKKDKKKSKRVACEKQARAKYGPKSKGKKASVHHGVPLGSSSRARG
jgi:DNA-binding beta-propeller fold protein YncE